MEVLFYVWLFVVGSIVMMEIVNMLVDGMVMCIFDVDVFVLICKGVLCIVEVIDDEVVVVICVYWIDMYNFVEGVGVVVFVVVM